MAKIYKDIVFWEWLYSFGQKLVTEEVFSQLKTDFIYSNKKMESEFEGKPFQWNFETALINFKIDKNVSLCALLHLDGVSYFEENLYLKYKDDYYVLGWFDAHSHNMVFKFSEFYSVITTIKNSATLSEYCSSFLFLARYVTLTNEKEAITLAKEAFTCFSKLLDSEEAFECRVTKKEPYNAIITDTNLVMKLKTIKALNSPLQYVINEGITWENERDTIDYLIGFGAHSIRSKQYKNGNKTPIDIYDVKQGSSDYKFPYQLWNDVIKNCEAHNANLK